MAAQFVEHFAVGGVPEPAHHVVGDTGDRFAIGRSDDFTNPFCMCFDRADLFARLDVPPDEPAVVAAGDGRLAGQGQAGDVALMLAQRLRSGLLADRSRS